MYKGLRGLITALLIITSLTFYGCSSNHQGNRQNSLHEMLKALKSYEADATISFLKDTEEHIIKMKQAAEAEGKYRLIIESPDHMKGYETRFDGSALSEYNPSTKASVPRKPNEARNQILLSTFVHQYLESADPKLEKGTLNGKSVHIIEIPIPGNYKYMTKQRVWFDEKTLVPLKMEIYDVNDNTTLQVLFENFKYNPKLNFN